MYVCMHGYEHMVYMCESVLVCECECVLKILILLRVTINSNDMFLE